MSGHRLTFAPPRHIPFTLPLVAAVVIATCDTVYFYRPLPSAFQEPQHVLLPALFIVARYLAAYLLLAPFVVIAPHLIWKADPAGLSVALSLATGGWLWLERPGQLGLRELLLRGLPVVLSVILGIWVWRQVRHSQNLSRITSRLIIVTILLCFELHLFYWMAHFEFRGLFRGGPWLAVLLQAFLATVCLLPLIVARSRLGLALATALASLMLLPAYVPFSRAYKVQASKEPLEFAGTIRHVVLIVVDTLRADAVGYGHPQWVSTPHIDRIASEAVVFENAISPAPWTFPAMTSLMTGIAPYVDSTNLAYETTPLPTLATLLEKQGYYTRGITGNFLLRRPYTVAAGWQELDVFSMFPLGDSRGSRGLADLFPETFRAGAATRHLTQAAVEWVKRNRQRPFFLWLHYLDPHYPYEPPGEYVSRAGSMRSVLALDKEMQTPEERADLKRLYADEVHFVDSQIGILMQTLRDVGIYDEALIVFTSDHGEEFWEHGGTSHGRSLYNEVLRVPLLFRLPRGSIRKRIASYVPTQAILPTVLALCGAKQPAAAAWNEPVTSLLENGATDDYPHPIVSSGTHAEEYQRSVVVDGFKYIKRLHSQTEELYSLQFDPAETRSVLNDHRDVVERARSALARHEALVDPLRAMVGNTGEADEETLRRLRSLGYTR